MLATGAEALKEAYEAFENKDAFADFAEAYDYCLEKYEEALAEEE